MMLLSEAPETKCLLIPTCAVTNLSKELILLKDLSKGIR
jgi:hypothetical protein